MATTAAVGTKARGLDAAEVETYRRDGYVVPKYRLPKNELSRLHSQIQRLIEDNPRLRNKLIPAAHVPSFNDIGIKTNGEIMEFASYPDILDLIEDLAGPDLILWTTSIFHKPPVDGAATPWHRDAHFWPIEPMATTSVWLAVTDSMSENGCFRAIPGSHLAKEFGKHFNDADPDLIFGGTISPDEYDESLARDVEVEAGQMILIDAGLIHGARHNHSQQARTGFVARYMPSSSYYNRNKEVTSDVADNRLRNEGAAFTLANRPLYLVRGVDRSGRNELTESHIRPAR